MPAEPRHFKIEIGTGNYSLTGQQVELWKYGTFAHAWFADAKREAGLGNAHAQLREIIFAVCAIESYLFEWIRNDVLNGEFRLLTSYFPVNQNPIGIRERWKQAINHLYEDGTISGKPNFREQYWKEFSELVDFRNGILHGRASRPDTEGLLEAEQPAPTAERLLEKGSGWAVRVVADVIRKLHEAVGTSPPEWL